MGKKTGNPNRDFIVFSITHSFTVINMLNLTAMVRQAGFTPFTMTKYF